MYEGAAPWGNPPRNPSLLPVVLGKVAQLRWAQGNLIPGYIDFTSEEKSLLFEAALGHVLGQDNVYHVSKSKAEANRNPTRY